ncbi:MAG: patatin-like phospholipase family protein, partial [Thermoproteota archaeon]|nr:patatin-like phospholipase family protein [Thermoproteota archaeon]
MIQHSDDSIIENVLILQGGGSLGAFGCGVYKAVVRNNIHLDIVAGTSIGGINAAIIAGSKNKEHTQELLENFWLELSESYVDLDKPSMYSYWPKLIGQQLHSYLFPYISPKLEPTASYFNTR